MFRRDILLVLLSFCLSAAAFSAPLRFVPQILLQPNGDTLHVFASGDEHYHWMHDKDDYTVLRDPVSGYVVYAVLEHGALVPSTYIVGRTDPRVVGIERALNVFPTIDRQHSLAKIADAPRNAGAAVTGTRANLVIFIRFKGEPEFVRPAAHYDTLLNAVAGLSLKHYYDEASLGQLAITSICIQDSMNTIVSYEDSQPRTYYMRFDSASNPNGYVDDQSARENSLVRNALTSVLARIPASLDLDRDLNGQIDNVCFVVSGSPAAWSDILWPHRGWVLTSPAFLINGKSVYTYNLHCEQSLTLGIACHEMGHSLGLPDLYHYYTARLNNSPVGPWDIMGSGMNPHMCNYLKYAYMKWIPTLPEITASGTYWIKGSTSPRNTMYKIASPRGGREWFLVEFRKKTGLYESGLPGSGLLVYRINEKVAGNKYGPPDEVYLYRPGGTVTEQGDVASAFYSAEARRTAINDMTNPSSFRTDGQAGGLSISNIGSAGGDSIRFDVQILSSTAVPVTSEYTAMKVPFDWIDIAKTGTEISNWVNGPAAPEVALDDGYTAAAIPLGFSFSFYGQRFDSLYVGINGLVSFTQQALCLSDDGVPTVTEKGSFNRSILWPGNVVFPNSIAVAYQDFDVNRKDGFGGGGVLYETIGDQFVLSWNGVGSFAHKGDTTNSFQLVLNKTTNVITLNYLKFGSESIRQVVKVGMEKDVTHGLEWIQSGDYPDHLPVDKSSVAFVPNGATAMKASATLPGTFGLEQNYPNPFNPSTTIVFSLPRRSLATLKIFDVLGRDVATLASEVLPAGTHSRQWNASGVASGVYFYRLRAEDRTGTKRLVVLR